MPTRIGAFLLATVLLLGNVQCMRMGPRTLRGDRFNYNKEGAQSSSEQMLLNILRLRYGEPIYFVEIGTMLSQYTFEVGGELSGWKNDLNTWKNPALRAVYGVDGDPGEQSGWGVNASYSDRPTITYSPLQGAAFSNQVMSPILPATVIYLSQSGWSIDRLLECCVQAINDAKNAPIHDVREADFWSTVQFRTIARLLKKMQDAGHLNLSVEVDPATHTTYLVPGTKSGAMDEETKELRGMLDLPEEIKRVRILAGGWRDEADELVMQTRSMLGVMVALSQGITVPEEHVLEKRVRELAVTEKTGGSRPWLAVAHSRYPHTNSFVQAKYKGYWWSISDSDWRSKRTFALLSYLFSLQATGAESFQPLVTVPAGG